MDAASLLRPDTDALLARFRSSGDTRALAALFDATAPGLFRSALHLEPDAASAEDAVQETFLALLETARRADRIDNVGGWLAGTLRNKVLRGRRTEKRAPDPLRLEPRLLDSDPPTEAARAEEIARVRAALEELPEPYREVAILRWRYGVEPAAIAHARGVPPGTVRSLLSRSAEKLRSSLGALAAVAFDVRPPRGLDAVRDQVLRAAVSPVPASTAAAASAALIGGALLAKKTLAAGVVIGACLLLLLGWWYAGDDRGTRAPSRPSTVAAPVSASSRATEHATSAAPPSANPSPVPPPSTGRRFLVRDALTGAPVGGALLSIAAARPREPLKTGPDGTVAIPAGLGPGARIEASADGYQTATLDLPAEEAPEIVEIPLVPGLEAAKAAFIAAAKRREALLASCRIRSWRLTWRGTDGHLFMAEETVTDLDEPRERWVRRDIGGKKSLSVDLEPDAKEISAEIVEAVREAKPSTIVVFDGERQVVMHPQNDYVVVDDKFDTFHRRGAIVWSVLRSEHAWLSTLMEKTTLQLLRQVGDGEWEWLFAGAPFKGQVWLSRVRTAGGDQLLPVKETSSRIEEADLEMVIRRCQAAFDEFEPRESVSSVKQVTSTVSVRGLLLPTRAGGDALFLKESPRAFTRYWLEYEPREPGSWPEDHFDTSRSPEAIAESVINDR